MPFSFGNTISLINELLKSGRMNFSNLANKAIYPTF